MTVVLQEEGRTLGDMVIEHHGCQGGLMGQQKRWTLDDRSQSETVLPYKT